MSNQDILDLWKAHCLKPALPKSFTNDAIVTFVGTAAGANGSTQLTAFFKQNGWLKHFSGSNHQPELGINVEVLTTFVAKNSVVEESVWDFVHEEVMECLLPGVSPTNRRIVIPVCTIATFQNGLVKSKRIYWDQGSVLRQIGLLPSDVSKLPQSARHHVSAKIMPILMGVEQVDRLRAPTEENANLLLKKLEHSGEEARFHHSKTNNQESMQQHPVAAAMAKTVPTYNVIAHTEHVDVRAAPMTKAVPTSNVVAPMEHVDVRAAPKQMPPPSPVIHRRSIDEESMEIDSNLSHGKRHINNNANASQFSISHKDTPHIDMNVHMGKRPGQLEKSNSDHFGANLEPRDGSNSDSRPSSARTGRSNQESSGMWASSSNGLGTMQSRPSSRVLRAPGGGSSIQLG